MEQYLDFDGGYFVEAGANDGFKQSNTYYLERFRGWRGVLVEADPKLAARCRRRRCAMTVHAALVASDYSDATIRLHEAGLMSVVEGALSASATEHHLARAREVEEPVTGKRRAVPARPLDDVLAFAGAPPGFDLLSLDVEGYEPAVLRGFDLPRWRPRFICVEVRDRAAIDSLLLDRYEVAAMLHRSPEYDDLLYRLR